MFFIFFPKRTSITIPSAIVGLEILRTMICCVEARYRGYDSAGIGVHGVPLKVRKKVGKVLRCAEGKIREGLNHLN